MNLPRQESTKLNYTCKFCVRITVLHLPSARPNQT